MTAASTARMIGASIVIIPVFGALAFLVGSYLGRYAARRLSDHLRAYADDLHQSDPGVVKGLRVVADFIDPRTPRTSRKTSR